MIHRSILLCGFALLLLGTTACAGSGSNRNSPYGYDPYGYGSGGYNSGSNYDRYPNRRDRYDYDRDYRDRYDYDRDYRDRDRNDRDRDYRNRDHNRDRDRDYRPQPPPPRPKPAEATPSCPTGTRFDGRSCIITDPKLKKKGGDGRINPCPKGQWLSNGRCIPG